jgi:hypothetical protein
LDSNREINENTNRKPNAAEVAHARIIMADMTVTIPDQDVPRVQEAYGSILGLGRPATPAEVNKAITEWLHHSTLDYERRKNTYTFVPPDMHFPP